MKNSKPPFFILGNPRSGTSLFRILISRHPELIVPPECGFMVWLQDQFHDFDGNPARTEMFVEALFQTKKIETWHLDRASLLQDLLATQPVNYAQLASSVYLNYARTRGYERLHRWGDKNNWYIHRIGNLRGLFPDAKFLHLVRDGRDVACSYREINRSPPKGKYAPVLPQRIEEIAEEWVNNNQVIQRELVGSDYLEVRYEDLVSNTKPVLLSVFQFLEARVTELTHDAYRGKEHDEPIEFLAWKKKLLEPVSTSSVGRYETGLTKTEIQTFNDIATQSLRAYGYQV